MSDGINIAAIIRLRLWMHFLDQLDLFQAVLHIRFDLMCDLQYAIEIFFGQKTAVEQVQDLVAALVESEAASDEDTQDGFVGIAVRLKVFADGGCAEFAYGLDIVQPAVEDGRKSRSEGDLRIDGNYRPPDLAANVDVDGREVAKGCRFFVETYDHQQEYSETFVKNSPSI